MVRIIEKIVAYGHGPLNASYFCVHSTANPGATAANHVSLWSRQPTYAVHLVSDWTEAYHTVPYDRLCYQVGNGNAYVEGLEICEATNRADFDKGIDIAADVVAQRLKAHGWGVDRMLTHLQCTQMWGGSDHTDPITYFDRWGYSWDAFKRLVQQKMNGDDEVVTQADIDKIAAAVVNYKLNGVLLRDRIIGTDKAANEAATASKGVKAMLDKVNFVTEFNWLKDRVYRIADWLFNGNNNRLSTKTRITADVSLSDEQVKFIAKEVVAQIKAMK